MIKVLVVDDSGLMVRLISDIINNDPELQVVGAASHGYDAVQKVKTLRPDVITMDVNMPRMDGLKAVGYIMSTAPTPIVMISSLTQKGTAATIQALNLGAIDFVPKPSGYVSLDIGDVASEIIAKIKLASKIRVVRTVKRTPHPRRTRYGSESPPPTLHLDTDALFDLSQVHDYKKVVVIGCSTGGPHALHEILQPFPADFPAPVLVVQHMPAKFTAKLAEFLDNRLALRIVEAQEHMGVRKGVVYIAPGAFHMKVQANRTIALEPGSSPSVPCPSVDVLMQSVASVYGNAAIGVILTGMGNDGTAGMNAIKDARGATIAQDEETSLVFGMPKSAIESGCIDSIAPLPKVSDEIMELVY